MGKQGQWRDQKGNKFMDLIILAWPKLECCKIKLHRIHGLHRALDRKAGSKNIICFSIKMDVFSKDQELHFCLIEEKQHQCCK